MMMIGWSFNEIVIVNDSNCGYSDPGYMMMYNCNSYSRNEDVGLGSL